MATEIHWLEKPEPKDYPAAHEYLRLIFDGAVAKKLVRRLYDRKPTEFAAKDIFRAAALAHPIGRDNFHVRHNLLKIEQGKRLSPILLVRDEIGLRTVIADGFHRLCAVYLLDEDIRVPCKIVGYPMK